MTKMTIYVARDFTKMPCVRRPEDGPHSGAEFRDKILLPALRSNETVTVDMDGVLTLGSSFLEEAFGGLVRKGYYTARELAGKLVLKFQLTSYVDEAWGYIKTARKE
jgi:hypothetical protein